jgi:hypothetical protein
LNKGILEDLREVRGLHQVFLTGVKVHHRRDGSLAQDETPDERLISISRCSDVRLPSLLAVCSSETVR